MARLTMQARLEALVGARRPEGLELATLTRYDIPSLAALHVSTHDQPETAESLWEATDELRVAFAGGFGRVLDDAFVGAWIDGELVGAALCVIDTPLDDAPRGPFLADLMVLPERRHRKVGTALVAEVARRADRWGYQTLGVHVDMGLAKNDEDMFTLLGFTEVEPAT